MAIRDHGLFRRLDMPAPDAAGGACYISYTNGPCVDTGVLVYNEGTLTLSVDVIRELAEVAGFAVDAEAVQHERDIAFLQNEVSRLNTEISDLNGVIDGFTSAVAKRVAR